jgi:hypothetical protein
VVVVWSSACVAAFLLRQQAGRGRHREAVRDGWGVRAGGRRPQGGSSGNSAGPEFPPDWSCPVGRRADHAGARRQRASACARGTSPRCAGVLNKRPVVRVRLGILRWRRARDVSLGARGPEGTRSFRSVPALTRGPAPHGATGDARAETESCLWPTVAVAVAGRHQATGCGCKACAVRETRSHLVQVQCSSLRDSNSS